jgi:FkbM family methyltransferase
MHKCELARYLVRAMRARFRDHKAELSELKHQIQSGDIVCDVGANKGSFVYWMSRWCQPGRVIAFEPQPDLAAGLTRLCSKASMSNVVVEQRAVHSSSGTQRLFIPEGHQPGASLLQPTAAAKSINVQTISLDEYFLGDDNVSAIKIDVEGAEMDVLLGARHTLRRCMPLLILECEQRHLPSRYKMNDVFSFLLSFGYEGSFVSQGKTIPLSAFKPNIHQNSDGNLFWKKKAYCNNFLFKPAAR